MTPATFIRTDGLVPGLSTITASGALAIRTRTLADKLWRVGAVVAGASLGPVGVLSADDALRLAWLPLRGISEDRLAIVGEDLARSWVDRVRSSPVSDLVARRRALGDRIVLATDLPLRLAQPLFAELLADELFANRLESRGGQLTGRLEDPLCSARLGGVELRRWADGAGVDLGRSVAYGARQDDLCLLASVGEPCAVDPDRTLRAHARRHGWALEVTR